MTLPAGISLTQKLSYTRFLKAMGRYGLSVAFLFVLTLPLAVAIFLGASLGGTSTWEHVLSNRLLPYTLTTLQVLAISAVAIIAVGVPSAWLIARTDFPGRQVFEWALILPLAMPGYVMAYAWGDLAGIAGPLQSALRVHFDITARDYWFPEIFSPGGLAFIFTTTLYPYVYITARAAFAAQSAHMFDAARSLGAGHWRLFGWVGLPVAAPAILAGLTLALMEASADYGAADFLGIPTLGVGIVRAWSSFGEPATAARLALVLMALAASLLLFSRTLLQGRTGAQSARMQQPTRRWTLTPVHSLLVIVLLSLLLCVSFLMPVARLIWLWLEQGGSHRSLWAPLRSTLILGTGGALITLLAALYVAFSDTSRGLLRMALLSGYAAPGAVLGLGALMLLSATGQPLNWTTGMGLLLLVYACRFTYAGLEPLLYRQSRVPASMGHVARSLGCSAWHKFWTVDLPLLRPGLVAGALILFVEILKELPATLMLRPFGWDTLAVRAHAYATDERLAEATLPALLIVSAGLIPVILMSARFTRSEQDTTI